MQEWITSSEASRLSGYNKEYIRRLIRTNKVKAQKFGSVWQIDKASLMDYVQDSDNSSDGRRGSTNISNQSERYKD